MTPRLDWFEAFLEEQDVDILAWAIGTAASRALAGRNDDSPAGPRLHPASAMSADLQNDAVLLPCTGREYVLLWRSALIAEAGCSRGPGGGSSWRPASVRERRTSSDLPSENVDILLLEKGLEPVDLGIIPRRHQRSKNPPTGGSASYCRRCQARKRRRLRRASRSMISHAGWPAGFECQSAVAIGGM